MRTLEISRASNGQYSYTIRQGAWVIVSMQWGTFDLASTVAQARARFSFDTITIL
jgi:hypothetical protein